MLILIYENTMICCSCYLNWNITSHYFMTLCFVWNPILETRIFVKATILERKMINPNGIRVDCHSNTRRNKCTHIDSNTYTSISKLNNVKRRVIPFEKPLCLVVVSLDSLIVSLLSSSYDLFVFKWRRNEWCIQINETHLSEWVVVFPMYYIIWPKFF